LIAWLFQLKSKDRFMKRLLLVFLILMAACKGYKSNQNPMSPEEVRVADLAQKLESDASPLPDEAQPQLKDPLAEFSERAARFHNACRRFGSNSLEARSAFDRLHYQASQVSTTLTKETDPPIFEKWETIRANLLEIAAILGYRPEKTE
jgi:hypothetical protein